jgi:hypothetical protein
VQQHIRIAVAHGLPVVRNIDSAQAQRATGFQSVGIVSDSNAQLCVYLTPLLLARWIILRRKIRDNARI